MFQRLSSGLSSFERSTASKQVRFSPASAARSFCDHPRSARINRMLRARTLAGGSSQFSSRGSLLNLAGSKSTYFSIHSSLGAPGAADNLGEDASNRYHRGGNSLPSAVQARGTSPPTAKGSNTWNAAVLICARKSLSHGESSRVCALPCFFGPPGAGVFRV